MAAPGYGAVDGAHPLIEIVEGGEEGHPNQAPVAIVVLGDQLPITIVPIDAGTTFAARRICRQARLLGENTVVLSLRQRIWMTAAIIATFAAGMISMAGNCGGNNLPMAGGAIAFIAGTTTAICLLRPS